MLAAKFLAAMAALQLAHFFALVAVFGHWTHKGAMLAIVLTIDASVLMFMLM